MENLCLEQQTIDRSFAENEELHSLRYARTLGIRSMHKQPFHTAAVQNMKHIVKAFLSWYPAFFFQKPPCLLSKTWRFL